MSARSRAQPWWGPRVDPIRTWAAWMATTIDAEIFERVYAEVMATIRQGT